MSTNEVPPTITNAIPAEVPASNHYDYSPPTLDEQFAAKATGVQNETSETPMYDAKLERVNTADIPVLQEQESHSLPYTSYESNPHLATVSQVEDVSMRRLEKNNRIYFSFINGMEKLEAVIFTLNGQQQIKIGNYILPLAMFLSYSHAQGDWRNSQPNKDLRTSSSNNEVHLTYPDGTVLQLDMCTVEMLTRAVCEISNELTPPFEKPHGLLRRLVDALW